MKRIGGLTALTWVTIEMLSMSAPYGFAAQAPFVCDLSEDGVASQPNPTNIASPNIASVDGKNALAVAGQQNRPHYFVSAGGNDRWSGLRADSAGDRSDGPFATIERARDALRADRKQRPINQRGTIYVRGGRYNLKQPILFTAEDAGTDIQAYPGEHPELSGAASITNLHKDRQGRFVTALAADPGREIFAGQVRQLLAFKPAASANGWRRAGAEPTADTFSYLAGEITPEDANPNLKVELFDGGRSFNVFTHIVSLDTAHHIATVAPSDRGPVGNIGSFRLLGNPNWIGRKDQFVWDGSAHRLIANPSNPAALAHAGIQVPILRTLLVFRDAHDNTVSGLHMVETGTASAQETENAAIVLENSFRITVSDNEFRNVGQAVRLVGSSDNLIQHNVVTETGSSGIELQDGSDRNLLAGNTLTGIGRLEKSSAAIYLHGTTANRITHNVVSDVARHGIGIDNWDDRTINIANIVEFNRISATNRDTADTGAIEMLGRSHINTNSVIRYNDIRDAGRSPTLGEQPNTPAASGIYLDDLTSDVLVCGNFISGAPLTAVQIHGGSKIVVRDNIALLDRPNASFVFFQGGDPSFDGQRFDFTWGAAAGAMPGKAHRLEVRFDNDALINGEDRDLFVRKVIIGKQVIAPTDSRARYVVDDGRILPGQTALPWNGALSWDISDDAFDHTGPVAVSVFAWSNPAAGIGGHFVLSIDGMRVGDGFADAAPDEMHENIVTRNIVYATAPGKNYYTDQHGGNPTVVANDYVDLTRQRQLNASPITDNQPIDKNPEFVDPTRGDFRLRPSSALIAAGFSDLAAYRNGMLEWTDQSDKKDLFH